MQKLLNANDFIFYFYFQLYIEWFTSNFFKILVENMHVYFMYYVPSVFFTYIFFTYYFVGQRYPNPLGYITFFRQASPKTFPEVFTKKVKFPSILKVCPTKTHKIRLYFLPSSHTFGFVFLYKKKKSTQNEVTCGRLNTKKKREKKGRKSCFLSSYQQKKTTTVLFVFYWQDTSHPHHTR